MLCWYIYICNLLGTADISDLLAQAEELLSGEGRRRRRPTFIEVSKENWDHIRPSLASNFRNGMRSRQWNIGELVSILLDSQVILILYNVITDTSAIKFPTTVIISTRVIINPKLTLGENSPQPYVLSYLFK